MPERKIIRRPAGSIMTHSLRVLGQEEISQISRKLGVSFRDPHLLDLAFIHGSWLNEHRWWTSGSNERLEFLGDAVIEIVVTEHLYRTYPNQEGDLSLWRHSLVNTARLTNVGVNLGLDQFLRLGSGESENGTARGRQYLIACLVEAVVGALYLDQGLEACRQFLNRVLVSELPRIIEQKLYLDPKSLLQERAQEVFRITPEYRVLREEGTPHDKIFALGVYVGEQLVGQGEGKNKRLAEAAAAQDALNKKFAVKC